MKTILAEMAEGDTVEIKIFRDGETELIKLKLGKR